MPVALLTAQTLFWRDTMITTPLGHQKKNWWVIHTNLVFRLVCSPCGIIW